MFPIILTGINLTNRFVNVSNMWDKKSLAPSVTYSMERAGEEQKKYHGFGISMKINDLTQV